MSDLQIGLLIVGGAVVAAVLVFNWIQERRFRKQADAAFQVPVADALMQDDARPRAVHERVEPALREPVLGDDGENETGEPHVRLDTDALFADDDVDVPVNAVPAPNPVAATPTERRPASASSAAAPAPYDELIEYRARFGCDGRSGERVVAGDHHGADAHRAHLVEPIAHPLLYHILQVDYAERPSIARDYERCAAAARNRLNRLGERARCLPRLTVERAEIMRYGVGGTLADRSSVHVHAAHARLCGEGDERRTHRLH